MASSSSLRIAMLGQKGFPAVWGGVEFHVDALARHLAARGHRVTVFVRPYYQKEVKKYKLEFPVNIRIKQIPSWRSKHFDALSHTFLSTLAAARGFDILHYHAIGPGSLLAFSRIIAPSPVKILTVHALDWQRKKWSMTASKLLKSGEAVAVLNADRVISVSMEIHNYLQETYGIESAVIPNGVNPARLKSPGKFLSSKGLTPQHYYLFVGRLVPEKGAHNLINAFRRISPAGWKLVLAGPEQEKAYVKKLKNPPDKRIIIAGTVQGENLSELYTNAGAFVLPSLLEGFPLSLLEGLSYGLPVIASNLPPVKEALEHFCSDNIFLFNPGDERDLENRLSEIPSFYKSRKALDKNICKRDLTGYSWEAMALKTEETYFNSL